MSEVMRYWVECSRCHRMVRVILERSPKEMERRTFTCRACRKELKSQP
jgi:hypothetical protein